VHKDNWETQPNNKYKLLTLISIILKLDEDLKLLSIHPEELTGQLFALPN
jgi:hypothetical protein